MSSKPADPRSGGAPGRSLATRLIVWYSASAFGLVLTATLVLYWGLSRGLDQEDDQFLQERIRVMRNLVGEGKAGAPELKWEVESEWEGFEYPQIYARIANADGSVVIESSGMAAILPSRVFAARPQSAYSQGKTVRTPRGKPFRIMSGPAAGSRLIQVAVDQTSDETVLRQYRDALGIVLALAAALSLAFGFRIARTGMKPLEEMVAATQRIRTSTLSERVRLEKPPAELAALADNFNAMLARLEDSFTRLSRFSADIAHELRTPLSNLRGATEVALSKARTSAEYQEVLASNLEECESLARIIDALLFIARADSPEAQVQRQPLDLSAELRKVAEFYEAAAAEKKVHLSVEAPRSVQAWADPTLFQRAVGNLVSNSLANTPEGGSIVVTAAQNESGATIVVSDTGRGVPAEHLPHVFERFYRVDRDRSRSSGGAGLGLSIVQSIARLHGGTASMESRPGHGAQVTLTFPNLTKS